MRLLAKIVIRHPWFVLLFTLAVTVFFGYQMGNIRIDNEVKNFLPDDQEDKQNYLRMAQVFKGEIVAFIGVSVDEGGAYKDIFQPEVLKAVQNLTDWLKTIEIEEEREHWVWVAAEPAPKIKSLQERSAGWCTPEDLKEIESRPVPESLDGMMKVWKCKEKGKYGLDDVIGLATMKIIRDKVLPPAAAGGQEAHQLLIEDVWSAVPATQAEADAVRERIKSWSMYLNNVVSEDLKSTLVVLYISEGAKIEYDEKLQLLLDEHIARIDRPDDGISYHVGGLPMVNVWLGRYLQKDLRLLTPIVFLIIIGVLILSFRRTMGVVMPTLNVLVASVWTIGFIAFVGKPLTLITSALPTLIVAVGSAYGIHVIHHYYESLREGKDHKESVRRSVVRIGMAVVMAGLTTVGGFLSLSTTTVVPIRDLGFFAAFGTFSALFTSLTFIPALLTVLRRPKPADVGVEGDEEIEAFGVGSGSLLTRALSGLSFVTVRYRWLILAGAAVVIGLCAFLASRTAVNSNIIEYFPSDSPIRVADDYLNRRFGGTSVFSLVLDGGQDDYWKDPEHLRKLDDFLAHVQKKFPDIGSVISVLDYLKKMNMALGFDDAAQYRIPDTRQAVADCLFLFSQKSDSLNSVLDFEYRRTRVAFRCRSGDSLTMLKIKREIEGWIKAEWPEMHVSKEKTESFLEKAAMVFGFRPPSSFTVSERYYFSGMNYLRLVIDQMIVLSQIRSLSFSLVVVFILSMIIFRSAVGGLLSVGPTVITVGVNFAIMVLAGIPLDVGTSLVSAAAIGCGIDYAIHFLNRFLIEQRAGFDMVRAIRRTHVSTSKAIIFNAASVAFGYFVMVMSSFQPVKRMGLLTGVAMFSASFSALVLIPVFLLIFKPRFARKAEEIGLSGASRSNDRTGGDRDHDEEKHNAGPARSGAADGRNPSRKAGVS